MSHLLASDTGQLCFQFIIHTAHAFPKEGVELYISEEKGGFSASCAISVPPVPESRPEVVTAGEESCVSGRVDHPTHLEQTSLSLFRFTSKITITRPSALGMSDPRNFGNPIIPQLYRIF